jgi:hypothetical protein
MSQELENKKRHLEALEHFLKSPAHAGFVAARHHDIKELNEAIVLVEPVDRVTEIEGFKLRGELRYAEQIVKTFEDARVTLKDRIDEMVEAELQAREQTKV